MKTYITTSIYIVFFIVELSITTAAFAADLERYVPAGTTAAITPYISTPQQSQSQQQSQQQAPAAPEFKKFNINGHKALSAHKKKSHKKSRKAIVKKVVAAAIPSNIPANNEPPRYIDIQAILARGKLAFVEEKKETSQAAQIAKSTQNPDEAIKDQAKTVYTYIPGSLYTMWCKKGFVTDIQLQTGESITSVNGGDTTRWLVEQIVSGGNGVPETQHVLVKPHQADLQTNIIISTDKRTYQVKALSNENTYNPIISWTYPADERSAMLFVQKQTIKEKSEVVTEEAVAPENLYFKYKIESNKGWLSNEYSWTPVKAFNDGTKTYIQVNPQMKNNESPALFVKGRDNNINLVNYRLKNNYFIVDRLFESAELRNGTDEIVTITKENK